MIRTKIRIKKRDKRICSFGRFEKNLGRNNKEKLSDYLYGTMVKKIGSVELDRVVIQFSVP